MAWIIYLYEPVAKIILLGIIGFFFFLIILKENKNNEALMAAAYISGAEILFRMTGGMVFYETGKYTVIIFLVIGMFYKGTSSKTVPFWTYLLILVPGIVVASITLDYHVDFRKAIAFNLSGPVSLGVSAIYCYYKKITRTQFNYLLLMLLLPIFSTMVYLFIYTPSIGEALMSGTNSNYAASGGYGPNQVATVMGLGAFILFTRLFVIKDKIINIIDLILFGMMSYRGIVTFSRGGMLTGLICIIAFLVIFYLKQPRKERSGIQFKLGIVLFLAIAVWIYTSMVTGGLITYRYTNRDASGKLEDEITTGRAELIVTELKGFYDYPVIGIGVGKGREFRSEVAGTITASHNEISRLLSEHGLLGLLAIVILIVVPIIFWFRFRNNYYFLAFMAFWFLTVNHSAMRVALPGFVYGLALLYIVEDKEPTKMRKLSSK